jgi:hypothetical protein
MSGWRCQRWRDPPAESRVRALSSAPVTPLPPNSNRWSVRPSGLAAKRMLRQPPARGEQRRRLICHKRTDFAPLEVMIFSVGGNVCFPTGEPTTCVYTKVWETGAFTNFLNGREAATCITSARLDPVHTCRIRRPWRGR